MQSALRNKFLPYMQRREKNVLRYPRIISLDRKEESMQTRFVGVFVCLFVTEFREDMHYHMQFVIQGLIKHTGKFPDGNFPPS